MTTLITGNTYPVKDQLKALGGKWNPTKKGWEVPDDKAEEARKLVNSTSTTSTSTSGPPRRKSWWRPCGYPGCNPSYCDECDGEGYKPENPWRRRRY